MTDAEICMAAARLIEERGMAKGLYNDDGHFCAIGALMQVAHHTLGNMGMEVAYRVFGGCGQIAQFNDAPDTTQDEVIALLESGAYSLR